MLLSIVAFDDGILRIYSAGTGLLGIVLKTVWPTLNITMTEIVGLLPQLQRNVEIFLPNGGFKIRELNWFKPMLEEDFSQPQPFSHIIASDIVVFTKDIPYIVGLVEFLVPVGSQVPIYIGCVTFREGLSFNTSTSSVLHIISMHIFVMSWFVIDPWTTF